MAQLRVVELAEKMTKIAAALDEAGWEALADQLGAIADEVEGLEPETPIQLLVARLLAESPTPLTDAAGDPLPIPGQAPALECMVMFHSGQVLRGALSTTPEGTLRLLSPGNEAGRPVLVEQFVPYSAVASVAVVREMKTERSILFDATSLR